MSADTHKIPSDQLADALLMHQRGRTVNRDCWSQRADPLQRYFRPMESLCRRAAGTGVRRARRPAVVPPRAHCGDGGRAVLASASGSPLRDVRQLIHRHHSQIRLFSRDLELSSQNILHRELLPAAVVTMALVDNSLLVYTVDNTLSHYLIVPTEDTITLRLCGSMSFDGVIAHPSAVRALSWMIPGAQKRVSSPPWRHSSTWRANGKFAAHRTWRPH